VYWNQTPRVNWSALKGAVKRERREYERAAVTAKWIGVMAQIDPAKQPTTEKMLGTKKSTRKMGGKEIGAAMRAWARKAKG
jgi:hypothetical protein